MPRDGVQFTSQELASALSYYDIGIIQGTKALNIGNRMAPKLMVISDRGRYVLKRRARGKDDRYHIAFAHALQEQLADKGFPVAELVRTQKHENTVVYLDSRAYELFHFIQGMRYAGSEEETIDAGRQLGLFHLSLPEFASKWQPLRGTFHDSAAARRHLKCAGSKSSGGGTDKHLRSTAEELMLYYNQSSVRVNELGFDSWPEQIVHGDWHPGNMLFASQHVAAVLDFDSAKVAPVVTDLANGLLQFSIVGGRPDPTDWPAYLDQTKMANFITGYREVVKLEDDMLNALLDLMVETMIAEAILPIAVTGFFGHLSGLEFLKMIYRKCEWIDQNKNLLMDIIFH